MESITDWARKIDKKARNKVSKQLQEELFKRVIASLQENKNTYQECVDTLCLFESKVVSLFYQNCYWTDVPDRVKWDNAFLSWANSKKPTTSATIRMALILQEKLKKAKGSADVLSELRWFSLHEDSHSVSTFESLREKIEKSDLRKLLDLDIRDWKIGRPLVVKMYGILFSDSRESKTQELYREFQIRNGLLESNSVVSETQPEQQPILSSDNSTEIAKQSTLKNNSLRTAPVLASVASVQSVQMEESPDQNMLRAEKTGTASDATPKEGVALAEAMLKWARNQAERQIVLHTRLSNLTTEVTRLDKQNEEMNARVISLESELLLIGKEKAALEQQLADATKMNTTLEAEKTAAQDTIRRLQIMSANSVRQELDGFKHELASALSRTIKDFGSDMSDLTDAEKVEVYVALMDELHDTLKHSGIVMEEN